MNDKNVQYDDSEQVTGRPVNKPRRTGIIIIVSVAAVILCFAAGLGGMWAYTMVRSGGPLAQRLSPANDGNKIVTQEEEDIATVASKVSPSVVSILTTSRSANDDGFGALQEKSGAGSGIIISKDGYILTNKHVVAQATKLAVMTSDGQTYDDVKVLGTDPLNDVAFIKVNGVNNLKAAELGDSGSIRVGQKVIAIGNSLGQYQNTVTSGIISGTGRPISAEAGDSVENLTDLLQTDAAINPGNSGGPLLNIAGQVIGINTAIAQDAQGIGFAIPINATKGVLKGVLANKGVTRAFLGVNYVTITGEVAKQYDLPVKRGAYVFNGAASSVVSGSPADKAGIKDKDIITKVGSVDVGDKLGVSSLIAEYAPGETVQLTILRSGKHMTTNVTLETYRAN